MPDTPWLDDACSLVDAFRAGQRSPVEELEASIAAIEVSELNAFSFLDLDKARDRAKKADLSLPFGGVPIGIKELEPFEGWPNTQASLVFKGEVHDHTATTITRIVDDGGVVPVGATTSSEFGGLNVSVSRINGVTHNGWKQGSTAGGSSAGSASAVSGGLVSIASGGDGGGSIRIPAGFNGLLGMKGTAGRIPRGPRTLIHPMTVVIGCVARSVRDAARWYDVCAGYDAHDPYSLPRIEGWERDLGTHDLKGKRIAVAPTLGAAIVRDEVQERVVSAAEALAKDAGLEIVDIPIQLPHLDLAWALGNLVGLALELGDRWPDCKDDLTTEIAFGLTVAEQMYNLDSAGRGEAARTQANEAMAEIFEQVDFVAAATNPDIAFPADCYLNTRVGDLQVEVGNNGALTIPANISGNPAVSIPVEQFDGLPVGMQIIGRHHEDALLFDLARLVEQARPWPLVSPEAPR